MNESIAAMATWVGGLSACAEVSDDARRGAALAAKILGEDAVSTLSERLCALPEAELERERVGAIHACIWMARADDETAADEAQLLDRVIAGSQLPWSSQQRLMGAISGTLTLEEIAKELTSSALRELILALAWEVALADGRLEDEERRAHAALAEAFGITEERSREIREAVTKITE